jgi:AcrR family transcriptional regulator
MANASKPKIVSKKKQPRIRDPERTRAKLLQATIDLLAEKGPDGLSLKEAARLADVSRGVAYQHFEDRDHLLREAKAWMSNRLLESAQSVQPALRKKKDVNLVMEESINNVARLVLDNREAARLLITDMLAGKKLDTDHLLYQLVVRDLKEFNAGGYASNDLDIEIMIFIMLGSIASLVMLSYLPHAQNTEALAQRYALEWTRLLREGMVAQIPKKRAGRSPQVQDAPKKTTVKIKSKSAKRSNGAR